MKTGRRNNIFTDHKGLTLVEIIIVLAIITTLTGIAAVSISMISGLPAKKCSEKLHSALSRVRISTMGKKTDVLLVQVQPDGVFIQEIMDQGKATEQKSAWEQVGSRGVKVCYTLVVSGTEGPQMEMNDGDSLQFAFDRSSGAFLDIVINGTESTDKKVGRLVCKKGNHSYSVRMVPVTGKMSVSKDSI